MDLMGFTAVRANRDTKACGKNKGGDSSCTLTTQCNPEHISLKTVLCCWDLAIGLWPYYLQREFSHVIAICLYTLPRAEATTACEKIHLVTAVLQTHHHEACMVISGDFNHTTVDSTLAGCELSIKTQQDN